MVRTETCYFFICYFSRYMLCFAADEMKRRRRREKYKANWCKLIQMLWNTYLRWVWVSTKLHQTQCHSTIYTVNRALVMKFTHHLTTQLSQYPIPHFFFFFRCLLFIYRFYFQPFKHTHADTDTRTHTPTAIWPLHKSIVRWLRLTGEWSTKINVWHHKLHTCHMKYEWRLIRLETWREKMERRQKPKCRTQNMVCMRTANEIYTCSRRWQCRQ